MQTHFVANCQDMHSNLPLSQDLLPFAVLWLHKKLENVGNVNVGIIELYPFGCYHYSEILVCCPSQAPKTTLKYANNQKHVCYG